MNRLICTHFNLDEPDKLLLELSDLERIKVAYLRRSFAAAEKAGVDTMAYYSWLERDGDPLGWGIKNTLAEKALNG